MIIGFMRLTFEKRKEKMSVVQKRVIKNNDDLIVQSQAQADSLEDPLYVISKKRDLPE